MQEQVVVFLFLTVDIEPFEVAEATVVPDETESLEESETSFSDDFAVGKGLEVVDCFHFLWLYFSSLGSSSSSS